MPLNIGRINHIRAVTVLNLPSKFKLYKDTTILSSTKNVLIKYRKGNVSNLFGIVREISDGDGERKSQQEVFGGAFGKRS